MRRFVFSKFISRILSVILILLLSSQFVVSDANSNNAAGSAVSHFALIKPYKECSFITLNKMREQTKNLSEEDKNVIKKYVYGAVRGEDTYLLINCYLRGTLNAFFPPKEITTPLKCRLDYYAKKLTAPISKSKLPKNIILYRGIDEKGMKIIFKDLNLNNIFDKPVTQNNLLILQQVLINKKFTEKGFMSTSYDIKCVKHTKFIFKILAPKNLEALLIEDIGKKSEKEVLINKNSSWKITNIDIQKDCVSKKDVYMITIKSVLE